MKNWFDKKKWKKEAGKMKVFLINFVQPESGDVLNPEEELIAKPRG